MAGLREAIAEKLSNDLMSANTQLILHTIAMEHYHFIFP